MFKLSNVIVTTDLSENAQAALPFAAALAKQHNAKLHLLYVEEPHPIYLTDGAMTVPQENNSIEEKIKREQRVRAEAEALAANESIIVVAHSKVGAAAKTIIEMADEISADCIVMSTHGLSGITRLLFGSVTEQVLRDSACPVLCVKPGEMPYNAGPLLLATDLSVESLTAIPFATTLARQQNCELHIIVVIEDQLYIPEGKPSPDSVDWMVAEHRSIEQKLQHFCADIQVRETLTVVPHLRHGKAAAEIVSVTAEIKAGCLIVATHGRSGLRRILVGSVAEQVIRTSKSPVLAVRSKMAAGVQSNSKVVAPA